MSHQTPPGTAQEGHSLTHRPQSCHRGSRPCPHSTLVRISKCVPAHAQPIVFSAVFVKVLIEKTQTKHRECPQPNHMVKAHVHRELSQAFLSLTTLLKASKVSAKASYLPWDMRARLNELTVSFYF